MSWIMWATCVANALLSFAGPRVARALPPRAAVRLLPVAMLAVSLGTGCMLAALGLFAVAQFPPVAVIGHWSPQALRAGQPVPLGAEVLAGAAVLVLLWGALHHAVRGGRDFVRAVRTCRLLGPDADGLVVIDDEEPEAYALPGIAGRIVVSTGMLGALSADERAALLAHEAAHLSRHHHLYVQLAGLAAAANPLLRPTARAVGLAVERDADEAAGAEVGDRRLVARAIARAALAKGAVRGGRRGTAPAPALPAGDSVTIRRTAALLAPAPHPRRVLGAGLALLTVVSASATAVTADQTDDQLDRAVLSAVAVPAHPAGSSSTLPHPRQPAAPARP